MARIDYERGAAAYREARTLPAAVLERWDEALRAITTTAPRPSAPVLDVGAGTGQFLDPLARWFAASVVALEPSPAMRAEAAGQHLVDRFPFVAGRAESLPFRGASFAAAWLSTVLHQFDDQRAAAGELRRVVQDGGRVAIRGFFADQTVTGLLARFPGIERAAATFPTTGATVELFESVGFHEPSVVDVVEPWSFPLDAWVARARRLRHTDSALRPLTDDEFERGIHAVLDERGGEADPAEPLLSEATLRLVVLTG
jgi:ubiquinone/menaquinone biosynthesis C-methylase UbiE